MVIEVLKERWIFPINFRYFPLVKYLMWATSKDLAALFPTSGKNICGLKKRKYFILKS